jgi:hypothetical protein
MNVVDPAESPGATVSQRTKRAESAERRIWSTLERMGHGPITLEAVRELDQAIDDRIGGLEDDK